MREERRLRVFKNRVLRKILGPKRDEVRIHNEELCYLYSLPGIIRKIRSRRMRWAGACGTYGGEERCTQVLVGRPEGKRPVGRLRRRWQDNIKIDL